MSRWPFELFLALRYLRPKRTFVSVITVISIIGVILGVAVLIIVISVMSGFDREMRDRILGFSAHLQVFQRQATLTNYPAVLRVVASNAHVRGVAPFVMGPVLLKTQPAEGNPFIRTPLVRGIELEYETNVSVIATSIVSGALDFDGCGVLVGSSLARALHLLVGDRVLIYSPRHLDKLQEMEKRGDKNGESVPLPDEFTVRGIFDVGYNEYNANVIVVALEDAQDLYSLGQSVHGLFVKVQDPFRVPEVRQQLGSALGPGYQITLWTEENSELLDAVMVERNVMFFLLFFIVIVAAFGIVNSQITFVVQKTREIGLLKAVGAAEGQILWLFLSQSMVIAVLGVSGGFGLGLLALTYRNEFLHLLRRWTGIEIFPAAIYGFSELPALISARDILIICGSALVSCVLAGLLPALKAASLQPVEALRHE
jgi:lipoprotein-releasing system permease protein